jgi:hypothetical protein
MLVNQNQVVGDKIEFYLEANRGDKQKTTTSQSV